MTTLTLLLALFQYSLSVIPWRQPPTKLMVLHTQLNTLLIAITKVGLTNPWMHGSPTDTVQS